MRSVGVKELKQNASRVLADVEANGETLVTVAGRPVAVLLPLDARHRWVSTEVVLAARAGTTAADQAEFLADIDELRRGDALVDPFER